jgi:adenine-specific DNA-methyltransferase
LEEAEIKLFTDFWNYKVFASAGIQTMIYLLKKSYPENDYELKYSVLKEDKISNRQLHNFLDFNSKIDFGKKYIIKQDNSKFDSKQIDFNSGNLGVILDKIALSGKFRLSDSEVANGIHPHFDFVNKKMLEILGREYKVGQGIFGLTRQELEFLNLNQNEQSLIKRYYPDTKNLKLYYSLPSDEFHIIYTTSEYKNPKSLNDKPKLKAHLDQYKSVITSDNKPYGLHRARKEEFFKTEKIVAQRKCPNRPIFTYIDYESYFSATFYIIKSDRIDLKYLTLILNSQLSKFWFRYKGKMQGNNYQIDKNPLVNIPIKIPVSYVSFLNLFGFRKQVELIDKKIIDAIPNIHISEAFEEVIDALVFELYFPEEFAAKGIAIEKYAQELFKPMDGLSEEEQIKAIKETYEILREKKNPLRNQILLMQIELKELLNPILSV